MENHSHPRLRTGDQPLVPRNVTDQIILWERERTRLQMEEVWCYQGKSLDEFQSVRQYVHDNENTFKLYTKYSKVEHVMAYLVRYRSRVGTHKAKK
jgi:hypothetical protein